MKELIAYLSSILNIKTDSELVVLDMQNELQGITDIPAYQKFIRDNLNYLGMDYKTGFQKFILLTDKYKRTQQVDTARLAESSSFAKQLANKVKSVSSYVMDNNELKCENFVSNKECIFSSFEQTHLSKIGTLLQCVKLQRSVSGDDLLFKKLNKNLQQIVINQSIGHKPKEKTAHMVSALLSGSIKNMGARS